MDVNYYLFVPVINFTAAGAANEQQISAIHA